MTDRFQIEDLTIPTAYIAAARRAFPMLQREDTDSGDEAEERRRIQRDIDATVAYDPDGALNHTMFYLVMAFDDARGRMVFEAPWHERDGQIKIVWDDAGRQRIYTRLDEELRRHSRALGASYTPIQLWSFMEIRHLMTAHPIGGCPIGEDYADSAVDQFERLFRGDGVGARRVVRGRRLRDSHFHRREPFPDHQRAGRAHRRPENPPTQG